MTKIRVEGNKGYNYVLVEKIDDRRLRLEVGHCGVITENLIVTAEALSSFLSEVKDNKKLLTRIKDSLDWEDSVNEKFFEGTMPMSEFIINKKIGK